MKKIIIGTFILITGIVLYYRIFNEKKETATESFYVKPAASKSHYFFGYLIPVGIIIITAGAGNLLSKKKKKKRVYYEIVKP